MPERVSADIEASLEKLQEKHAKAWQKEMKPSKLEMQSAMTPCAHTQDHFDYDEEVV